MTLETQVKKLLEDKSIGCGYKIFVILGALVFYYVFVAITSGFYLWYILGLEASWIIGFYIFLGCFFSKYLGRISTTVFWLTLTLWLCGVSFHQILEFFRGY